MIPGLHSIGEPSPDKKAEKRPAHYYGDHVRRLFLTGGAIMIFGYPFFTEQINLPLWLAIFAVLIISVFAGLQSPRYPWSAVVNALIATVACIVFTTKAVDAYTSGQYAIYPLFFWMNQLLSLIFFFGIYYSIKSIRAKSKV
jgi:hypothetical protein